MKPVIRVFVALAVTLAFMAVVGPADMQDVPRISAAKVKSMLGNTNVIILDVRTARHWNASNPKIKGAIGEDPTGTKSWAGTHPKNKSIITYCA